ncbi:hypothetical protein NO430_21945 (plasmid) [Xanthomonas oryzae pv. oryzae]|uniref:hypothetical protein n=1 Tax=Xanthomonas oryzae TaxID=347 RepID=UPI00217D0D7E|nr:hypothetical protein [Xanthomonas oryzae]UWI58949.1 hypothetical protein NO430_21945 [Xanthomonas oryzae pv. oryzae]
MTLQELYNVLAAALSLGVDPDTPVCITEDGQVAELAYIGCHCGPYLDDPSPKMRARLPVAPRPFILLGEIDAEDAEDWDDAGLHYDFHVRDMTDAFAAARRRSNKL